MDFEAIKYYKRLENLGKAPLQHQKSSDKASKNGPLSREKTEELMKKRGKPTVAPKTKPHVVPEPLSLEEIKQLRETRKKEAARKRELGSEKAMRNETPLPRQISLMDNKAEGISGRSFLEEYSGEVVYIARAMNSKDENGKPRMKCGLGTQVDIFKDDILVDLVPIKLGAVPVKVDNSTQYEDPENIITDQEENQENDQADQGEGTEEITPEEIQGPFIDLDTAWVQYSQENDPYCDLEEVSNSEEFDIVFDEIRFAPDACQIMKIVAKVVFSGEPRNQEHNAFPKGDSDGRIIRLESNRFHVNSEKTEMGGESAILFRVVGVLKQTDSLGLVGMAAFQLFDEDLTTSLRVGAHQMRLYQGALDRTKAPNEHSFQASQAIPALTVLFRILPHTEDVPVAPSYDTGAYHSGLCEPTERELNILKHMSCYGKIPLTLKKAALKQQELDSLKGGENSEDGPKIDDSSDFDEVAKWIQQRLDKKHWANGTEMGKLDATRVIAYSPQFGFNIKIDQAVNVEAKTMYTNAVCLVANPSVVKTSKMPCFVTSVHDFNAPVNSPDWSNGEPGVVKNESIEPGAKIIFYVLGIDAEYTPDPALEKPGVVKAKKGRDKGQIEVTLNPESYLGWAVMDAFDEKTNCIKNGIHYLPVIKGQPPLRSREFKSTPSVKFIQNNLKNENIGFLETRGVLKIQVFDGYSESKENTVTVEDKSMLEAFGEMNKKKFEESLAAGKDGLKLSAKVTQSMPKEAQKEGTEHESYKTAERLYEESLNSCFVDLVRGAFNSQSVELKARNSDFDDPGMQQSIN